MDPTTTDDSNNTTKTNETKNTILSTNPNNNISIENDDDNNSNSNNTKIVIVSETKKRQQLINNTSYFDRILNFYNIFVSKPSNQDKILKLVQWSLYIASVSVARIHQTRRNRMTNKNNNNKDSTCRENVDNTSTNKLMDVSSGLRKLYSEISMARYVIRILGFPTALEAWRTNSWSLDNTNTMYRTIGKILAGSMVLYYPTELLAYLHWTAPQILPSRLLSISGPRTGNRWSSISCQCWTIYIITELLQGLIQWNEIRTKLQQQQQQLRNHDHNQRMTNPNSNNNNSNEIACDTVISVDSDDANEHKIEQLQVSYEQNQLQVYRNMLFLLPCIHWSLPNWDTQPWLSELTANGLMWFESIVSIYQAIRAQQQ